MGDSIQPNLRAAFANDSLTANSNSFGFYLFSLPHSMNPLIGVPPSNYQISDQSKNCHPSINTQTAACETSQQLYLNQFPVHPLTSTCDNKQYRNQNALDSKCGSNNRNIVYGNQNEDSRDSTSGSLKTRLHRLHCLPLRSRHNLSENKTSDKCLLPASSQDVHRFPKSVSFCSDYEMSCNSPASTIHAKDGASEVINQEMSLVHGMALGRSMSTEHSLLTSMAITSTAQETSVHQSSAKISAPVTSKSMFPHYISDHCQPSLPATSTGSSAPSSASTSLIAPGEESVHECPSPQVSDLGSEDTYVSVSHPTFVQNYASLTPWTSKLTAPGYTPLPKPTSDAMPIPLEHIDQEYMLTMSSPSQEMNAQSWQAKHNRMYSHLKPRLSVDCYNEAISNNKIKNSSLDGSVHSHKPKMMPNKEYRFRRTAEALHKSGLWGVAMKTGSLIKRNRELQKELEEFRSDAVAFLKSVIKNPQNRGFIENVLSTALTTSTNGSRNGSSVMTVVVSAAASAKMDSDSSSDDSMSGNAST